MQGKVRSVCSNVWVVISSDLSHEKLRVSTGVLSVNVYGARAMQTLLRHWCVTSGFDNCNAVIAGTPQVTTNKSVLNATAVARVVTAARKLDGGLSDSPLLHTE